ncbi:tetratricopeptide repeat (TPR)-like superfamily protein [Tasmannia lanceolata]|uniref:tetratricopeptide repeat (TPR)-like superfamily protein n=1 Tax=Tasmannia lanceolata TaxID=3420 RepID=UPI00406298AC
MIGLPSPALFKFTTQFFQHSPFPSINPLLLNASHCGFLLQTYGKKKSLPQCKQLHAYMIASGLLFSHNNSDQTARLTSKLSAFYAICGSTNQARIIFNEIVPKNAFLWNSMIIGYVNNGLSEDALHLFVKMLKSEQKPDNFTFPFVLKACGELSLLELGMEIHGQVVAFGLQTDTYVQNSLLSMYMNCGEKEKARLVFDKMRNRTIVSWNTMIVGNFQNGYGDEALEVFDQMKDEGVEPDCATVVSVLPVCAYLKDLRRGTEVHKFVNAKGLGGHIAVRNSLLDMYAKCESLEDARRVFDEVKCERDVISWTAMIGGYVLNGYEREALALSHQMRVLGIRPNSVTLSTLLTACASLSSLKHGKCLHGSAVRLVLEFHVIVETALIDMYSKCGNVDLGYRVFINSSRKTVTWNAIISGYTRNTLAREAIMLFKWMQSEKINPNVTTMICLLPAYACSADLQQAKNIHCYLIKSGFHLRVETATCLIDVYSKSGSLDSAHEVFHGLTKKDIVSWSAIIGGYGMHGQCRAAILLFDQMVQSGVKPNEITFTSILYACSHAGFVDEGLYFFKSIVEDHHMKPRLDHYACIVDLLGRAGQIEEAHEIIKTMPFEPNHAVWGALLGACVIHEDVEIGRVAAEHLFKLEPENTGNYVLLANIYAAVGRWDDVKAVRKVMNERGLRKTPGCSLIEVRNMVCGA